MEVSMSKTITVILVIALFGSLIGIGFLYNQNKNAMNLLGAKETELIQKTDKLIHTEDALKKAQTDLEDLQNSLNIKQLAFDKLQKDFYNASAEANRLKTARCSKVISASEIQGITTNQGLVDIITGIVESNYRFSSVQTTFDTIWSNSKTAIFNILNSDNESFQVVVTWDFKISKVVGIYDINKACYYLNN